MSLQVSHYNMLRASHEGSQKVVVRTVITVRFVPEADFLKILRAQQLGAGHIKYPQNYREYLKFL
ncbi:hypothetical protein AUN00_23200 [Cronobacter sakazakii]|nr:hypothetical protein FZI00_21280 [Cronobacter sakazakii]KAB0866168.1 hypothetical protein FZI03_20645 [Cronobacter sakazakii]KAB0877722.1 hypothetical protein FZI50_20430 [Cronobacter sakazakii]PQY88489.1 hypothetical protein C5935_22540 [Cronobacter sakazakii]PQY92727.1 hypothetical protein C5953_22020 [Cronobacter sakazakii]